MEKLLRETWIQEKMPQKWTKAIICPIYNRGDKLDCQNYNIWSDTIKNIIEEYQCEYRRANTYAEWNTSRKLQTQDTSRPISETKRSIEGIEVFGT